jgi:glycosyltransferase involved in cell wall biosynthesis
MLDSISIVIPAYNEAEAIGETIAAIQYAFVNENFEVEIIVVDDYSNDKTAEVASRFSIRLIQHSYNKGYGASLKTGIRHAKFNLIVIIDADGTYPANEIPRLVKQMISYDMVVGARIGEDVSIPLFRRPAKWLLNTLANYLSNIKIPDINSGLRVFRKDEVMQYFRLLPSGFSFTTSITLAMLTNDYNILFVPVDYYKRKGKSKIRPIQDTLSFFSLIIRMILSYRPLRVFFPLGLVLSIISFGKVVYDIIEYDFHLATSTVVLLTLTFQVFVLGLIADLVVSLHKT